VETVVSTAKPSAAPICWAMLTSAEATPARSSATRCTAVRVNGTYAMPRPNAVENSAGMT
jgi:hypothetical protein